MVVLIPHTTEELKLIRFQKELINQINSQDDVFYAVKPLWIEIPEFSAQNKEMLKEVSKSIKKVTLSNPFYSDCDNEVSLKVFVTTQTQVIETKVSLLKGWSGRLNISLDNKKSPVENLKIFRLGIPFLYNQNQKSLKDSLWHKGQ